MREEDVATDGARMNTDEAKQLLVCDMGILPVQILLNRRLSRFTQI